MVLQLQIWRCVVLYQDTSNRPRILITVPLSLLSLVSLGRSVSISTPPIQISHENIRMRRHDVSQWGHGLLNSLYITLPSRQYHTRNTNCFRLIYRGRHFQDILGAEHGSPYIDIMTMCVESSALVVIFDGTYTALTFAQRRRPDAYWALIPFQLLPHICVCFLEHHHI